MSPACRMASGASAAMWPAAAGCGAECVSATTTSRSLSASPIGIDATARVSLGAGMATVLAFPYPSPRASLRRMKKILVLGGGFGGLETATGLATVLRDGYKITLVDRKESFYVGFA